jgi:hypothetical protein
MTEATPTPPDTPPWTDFLALDDTALLAQCDLDRFRASGPGGQKRNKTESAVRLRHRPTGIAAEANESRSQHENRARALRRLRLAIALEARATWTPSDRPADLAEALRVGRGRRIEVGRRDARYPSVVAALFDLLATAAWELTPAAEALGLTTSALGRFLESEPVVWRAAQQQRQLAGLAPLRSRG